VSAFRDLLVEAHAKGETHMRFEVDLAAFFANSESDAWIASGRVTELTSFGRTGEEALRRFVEKVAL
jgi:hypothetical protein